MGGSSFRFRVVVSPTEWPDLIHSFAALPRPILLVPFSRTLPQQARDTLQPTPSPPAITRNNEHSTSAALHSTTSSRLTSITDQVYRVRHPATPPAAAPPLTITSTSYGWGILIVGTSSHTHRLSPNHKLTPAQPAAAHTTSPRNPSTPSAPRRRPPTGAARRCSSVSSSRLIPPAAMAARTRAMRPARTRRPRGTRPRRRASRCGRRASTRRASRFGAGRGIGLAER